VGGPADDAVMSRIVVLSSNGRAAREAAHGFVQPGDIIVVPSQYLFREQERESVWQTALRSLASAVAAVLLFK